MAASFSNLIEDLDSKDLRKRAEAEAKLTQAGEAAIPDLIAALQRDDQPIRQQVATILGQIGRPAILPLLPLLSEYQDKPRHGWTAFSAARALARIGVEALDPLLERADDADERVRRSTAYGLGLLGDPRAVGPLLKLLNDKDFYVRYEAIRALGRIGDGQALTPLLNSLQDEHPGIRSGAAEALGELSDKRAVAALIDVLDDEGEGIAGPVARSLGMLGDPAAVPYLIPVLYHDFADVGREAAYALAKVGDEAVQPLIGELSSEDETVRELAALALGEIGNPTAIQPLIDGLRAADTYGRYEYSTALGKMGSAAIPDVVQLLTDKDPEMQYHAVLALRDVGDAAAVPHLISALKNADKTLAGTRVCNIAIEALKKIGTDQALQAVETWQTSQ